MTVEIVRSRSSDNVTVIMNGKTEFNGEIKNVDLNFLEVLRKLGSDIIETEVE